MGLSNSCTADAGLCCCSCRYSRRLRRPGWTGREWPPDARARPAGAAASPAAQAGGADEPGPHRESHNKWRCQGGEWRPGRRCALHSALHSAPSCGILPCRRQTCSCDSRLALINCLAVTTPGRSTLSPSPPCSGKRGHSMDHRERLVMSPAGDHLDVQNGFVIDHQRQKGGLAQQTYSQYV